MPFGTLKNLPLPWAGVQQAWQHLNLITRDLPCNSCIETHFPALNIVITKVEY
jgi:hypothetical protein